MGAQEGPCAVSLGRPLCPIIGFQCWPFGVTMKSVFFVLPRRRQVSKEGAQTESRAPEAGISSLLGNGCPRRAPTIADDDLLCLTVSGHDL